MPRQRYKVVVLWGKSSRRVTKVKRTGMEETLVILILASSGSEIVLWRKRDYL